MWSLTPNHILCIFSAVSPAFVLIARVSSFARSKTAFNFSTKLLTSGRESGLLLTAFANSSTMASTSLIASSQIFFASLIAASSLPISSLGFASSPFFDGSVVPTGLSCSTPFPFLLGSLPSTLGVVFSAPCVPAFVGSTFGCVASDTFVSLL